MDDHWATIERVAEAILAVPEEPKTLEAADLAPLLRA